MDDIIVQRQREEEEKSQIIKLNCPECDKRVEENKVSLIYMEILALKELCNVLDVSTSVQLSWLRAVYSN